VTLGVTSRGVTPSVCSCDFKYEGTAGLETSNSLGAGVMASQDENDSERRDEMSILDAGVESSSQDLDD
jgi:hypothetical protein